MEEDKKNLDEILKEWFDKLPKNFGQAILDVGVEEKVQKIANEHGLSSILAVSLGNEVTKMLLGISNKKEFTEDLSVALSLKEPELEPILKSVTEMIIDPIEKEVLSKRLGSSKSSLEGIEKTVAEIGKVNGLHIDETGILAEEIRDVVSGAKKTVDFAKNIKSVLGLDESQTNSVVKAVNDKIFSILRDSLRKATGHYEEPKEELDRESILKEIEAETLSQQTQLHQEDK